jgi:AhpC/TSA family
MGRTSLAIVTLLIGLSLSWGRGGGGGGTEPFGIDLNGHPVEELAPAGSQAVVLFFTASDCPISNRYVPEIQRLAQEFGPRGVRVWFVYPNPGDDAQVVRAHQSQYAITAHAVLDNKQALTQMAHVSVTPEAAVFVPEGTRLREVYRGRIDDRYIAFGQERPQATHHDLENAIRAVLANQPVPHPEGSPVGCSIVTLHP